MLRIAMGFQDGYQKAIRILLGIQRLNCPFRPAICAAPYEGTKLLRNSHPSERSALRCIALRQQATSVKSYDVSRARRP